MPLNGGWGGMDNGRAGGVTTPGSTDFPVGLEIQNAFLFTIQKLVKKNKTWQLSFTLYPCVTVWNSTPAQNKSRAVQGSGFTYSRLDVCKTEKLALVFSVASTSAKTTLWCYWKFKKFSFQLLHEAVSTTARLKCLRQTQIFHNDRAS